MKTLNSHKEIKITYKPDKNSFFVIGILSSDKIYKISWEINKFLNVNLSDSNEIKFNNSSFACFSDKSSENFVFALIENRNSQTILSAKYHEFDFFFVFPSSYSEIEDVKGFAKNLQTNKIVRAAFIIEPCKIISEVISFI